MPWNWHNLLSKVSADAYGGVPLPVVAVIVLSIALLLGNAGLLVINSIHSFEANREYARSYEIRDALTRVAAAVGSAESANRAYRQAAQAADREVGLRSTREARAQLRRLRGLTGEMAELDPVASRSLSRTEQSLSLDASAVQSQGPGQSAVAVPQLRPDAADDLHALLAKMIGTEEARMEALQSRVARSLWITIVLVVLATLITVSVLIGLQRLLRRYVAARMAAVSALRSANEQLNREVEERTSELTDLSRHLIRVSEEEKARLARELHDTLGSNLTAISMDLNWVARRLTQAQTDLRERMQGALRMLVQTVELKHQVIEGLRPSHLDNLGLTFAMQTHCKEFTRLTGMPCTVEVDEDFEELKPTLSIVLYRVVQEALTNVMKHAQASQVTVSLRRERRGDDDGLHLQIADDGIGMDTSNQVRRLSHGLTGMRERVRQVNGSFRLARSESGGVLVDVFIPAPVQSQPTSQVTRLMETFPAARPHPMAHGCSGAHGG